MAGGFAGPEAWRHLTRQRRDRTCQARLHPALPLRICRSQSLLKSAKSFELVPHQLLTWFAEPTNTFQVSVTSFHKFSVAEPRHRYRHSLMSKTPYVQISLDLLRKTVYRGCFYDYWRFRTDSDDTNILISESPFCVHVDLIMVCLSLAFSVLCYDVLIPLRMVAERI